MPSLTLGNRPVSDACTVAQAAKFAGIECHFIHNATAKVFMQWFHKFLEDASSCFFFYDAGLSARIHCHDIQDKCDDAQYVEDSELAEIRLIDLIGSKNPDSTVILISDWCHERNIWSFNPNRWEEIPPRMISIGVAEASERADEITEDRPSMELLSRINRGVFASGMFDALKANPAMTPLELKQRLDADLNGHHQTVTIETTSPEMLTQALFQSVKKESTTPKSTLPSAPASANPAGSGPNMPASKTASSIGQAGAAIIGSYPRTNLVSTPGSRPQMTFATGIPAETPIGTSQRPAGTESCHDTTNEVHRHCVKIQPDAVYTYDTRRVNWGPSEEEPDMWCVTEVTKTDNNGNVSKHRDHCRERSRFFCGSGWIPRNPTGDTFPLASAAGASRRTMRAPKTPSSVGKGCGTAVLDFRASAASVAASVKMLCPPLSTTNMTYGSWYLRNRS
jgi:hypothetical protein